MPLHCACWKGQLEAVEFLLSHGARTCESDVSLKTALHWAVQYDHFNALHMLLKVSHIHTCLLSFNVCVMYETVNENNFPAVLLLVALHRCFLNLFSQPVKLYD